MSGGSYDYLYSKEIGELLNSNTSLERMAKRLSELGYARDASEETVQLILAMRSFEVRMEAIKNRLAGVWKAVEWWDSRDWSEDEVKKALRVYRGEE